MKISLEEKSDMRENANSCGVTAHFFQSELLPLHKSRGERARIVFQLGDRNDRGGLNRIVVETANMLSKDFDVVICSWGDVLKDGYKSCGAVKELSTYNPAETPSQYMTLLSFIGTDLYILSYCCAKDYLPLLGLAKAHHIKTIAWNHEDYFLPYWRQSLWSSLPNRKKYFPRADAVVWLNSYSNTVYSTLYKNGICIPNSATGTVSGLPKADRGRRLVAVGRFDDQQKGLDDLLRAFAHIRNSFSDAELYVVGSVDLKLPIRGLPGMTCGDFIQKANLTNECLHLTGWVDNVDEYYQSSALQVFPSIYEGFGLVVLEAAANGTPTVSYTGSGTEDIIKNYVDGMVVERGDWEELARTIIWLLEDSQRIAKLQNNLPVLLERYGKEKIKAKWTTLIGVLLKGSQEEQKAYFTANHTEISAMRSKMALHEYEDAVTKMYELYKKGIEDAERDRTWRNATLFRLTKKSFRIWQKDGLKGLLNKIRQKLIAQWRRR